MSRPSRSNALLERLIVLSIGLYTILPEGLRFSKIIILPPEGLSVSSD